MRYAKTNTTRAWFNDHIYMLVNLTDWYLLPTIEISHLYWERPKCRWAVYIKWLCFTLRNN